MPVETPSLFARVIQDHLELKRRNAELEPAMPLEGYRIDDPFNNHPLFKTEEQARLEETMDGDEPAVSLDSVPLTWPGEESVEHVTPERRAGRGLRPLVEVPRLRLGRLASRFESSGGRRLRFERPPASKPHSRPFTRAGDHLDGP